MEFDTTSDAHIYIYGCMCFKFQMDAGGIDKEMQ